MTVRATSTPQHFGVPSVSGVVLGDRMDLTELQSSQAETGEQMAGCSQQAPGLSGCLPQGETGEQGCLVAKPALPVPPGKHDRVWVCGQSQAIFTGVSAGDKQRTTTSCIVLTI